MGVTAFVLKYRLGPRYHHPIELGDAQRAIRTVRSRAAEFNIIPDRIGMMGFSAGGHLTSTAGTHFDAGKPDATDPIERVSSRPDFLILGYPVVSFDPAIRHNGSMRNLLGDNPDPKLIEDLSNELRVTPETPPTFLFHTTNDPGVPVENSVRFYLALRKAKVPVEMHLFENGPHGVGMALNDPALSAWPSLLLNWMRARGLPDKAVSITGKVPGANVLSARVLRVPRRQRCCSPECDAVAACCGVHPSLLPIAHSTWHLAPWHFGTLAPWHSGTFGTLALWHS